MRITQSNLCALPCVMYGNLDFIGVDTERKQSWRLPSFRKKKKIIFHGNESELAFRVVLYVYKHQKTMTHILNQKRNGKGRSM